MIDYQVMQERSKKCKTNKRDVMMMWLSIPQQFLASESGQKCSKEWQECANMGEAAEFMRGNKVLLNFTVFMTL